MDYGGMYLTKIPILKTWMPTLILRNGVETKSIYTFHNNLDIESATVAYTANGSAAFMVYGLYQVVCESDVTYYPFDEHKCMISLVSTDMYNDITLSSNLGVHLGLLIPNSEWSINPNTVSTTKKNLEVIFQGYTTYTDQIEFNFVISREHIFPFLNIILPVMCLSLAHVLVFQLPVDYGERTSFSFTLLLTLVVFMTMVSDRLPASNNISFFNIFLLQQLFSSILTTGLVVFSIRLFYSDPNLTNIGWQRRFILLMYKFSCNRLCKGKIKCIAKETGSEKEATWKNVSSFVDNVCFWILVWNNGIQFCVYGMIIILR